MLLCSGKVYYDLVDYRERNKHDEVAIIRVEQFYPLADDMLRKELEPYDEARPSSGCRRSRETWARGRCLGHAVWATLFGRFPLAYVGRAESASPATGSKAVHKREQQSLVERAFRPNRESNSTADDEDTMSIELKIPNVGESIQEVQIGQWLKQEGDRVDAGRKRRRARYR